MTHFAFEPDELVESIGLARSCLNLSSTPATADHSPTDHILDISVYEAQLARSAILGGPACVQVSVPAGETKADALWAVSVSYRHPSTSPRASADAWVTLFPEGELIGQVVNDDAIRLATRLIGDLRELRASLD